MTIKLSAFTEKSSPTPFAVIVLPIIGIKPSVQFAGAKQQYVGGVQEQSKRIRTLYEVHTIPYLTNTSVGYSTESVYGAVLSMMSAPYLKIEHDDDTFPRWADEENFPSTSLANGVWVIIDSVVVETMWELGKEQLILQLQSQEVSE